MANDSGILEVQARKAKEHHVSISTLLLDHVLTGSTLLNRLLESSRAHVDLSCNAIAMNSRSSYYPLDIPCPLPNVDFAPIYFCKSLYIRRIHLVPTQDHQKLITGQHGPAITAEIDCRPEPK